MVRRTDPKDDDWQHVQDPKKRKAIQDRLAQRARRQRLREAKTTSTHNTQLTRTPKRCNCDPFTHTPVRGANIPHHIYTLPTPDPDMETALTIDPILQFLHTSPKPHIAIDFTLTPLTPQSSSEYLLSPQSQPQPPQTVFSALYFNGTILGLSCSVCITSRSPFPSPHHPLSLHPTETQLMHVHPRWYDRLPFPKMRDSLIKLTGVIDEEELLRDLFTMPSWTIDTTCGWERSCWDARAWKMEEGWEGKWGWLMV